MIKKILSILLVIAMVLTIAPVSAFAENESISLGDVDGDGYSTSDDCRLVMRAAVGLDKLEDFQSVAADINGDGEINASDARSILRVSAILENIENTAPVRNYLDLPRSDAVSINASSFVYDFSAHTVDIIISGENISGLRNANLFFEYDQDVMEFVSIRALSYSATEVGGLYADGKLSFGFYFIDSFNRDNSEIACITFKMLKPEDAFLDCKIGTWTGTDVPNDICITIGHKYAYEKQQSEFSLIVSDAQVGENITVTVGLTDMSQLECLDLSFYYDCEYLEYVDISANNDADLDGFATDLNSNGDLLCGIVYSWNAGRDRNLVDITFKVLREGNSVFTVKRRSVEGCDLPIESSISIDVHNHNYYEVVTNPTCVTQGYTTYTCSICGDCYSDNYVDASNDYHNYESIVTPADIETAGYTKYTCILCGDSYVGDYTEPLHTYVDGSLNCDTCGKYALKYKIDNGEVTITDCDESFSGDIVIPDTIEGYPVTTIGSYALNWCEKLTSVVIPDSVTLAEYGTFYFCTNLESVTIGTGITSICDEMFYGCSSLKSITIPDNIIEIGGGAFFTSGIEAIEIPGTVKTIGPESFAYCSRLVSVELSDGVTTIENGAFFGCENLESVIIPASVTTFRFEIFDHCEKMKIYGYTGSAVETYANENGITFVALCNHRNTVVKKAIDATCTADGYTGDVHCEMCDELLTKGEAVSATGHTEEIMPEVPATYTETGLTEGKKCSVCNTVLVEQTEIPTLINPGLTTENENITVEENGVILTPEMSVVEIIANVENENVCILNKDDEVIANNELVGTSSKIQVLDSEGNVLSSYDVVVSADVNGDATITAADARLTLRASANLDKIVGVYAIAADYNGDDDITATDARLILRKSAGLE